VNTSDIYGEIKIVRPNRNYICLTERKKSKTEVTNSPAFKKECFSLKSNVISNLT